MSQESTEQEFLQIYAVKWATRITLFHLRNKCFYSIQLFICSIAYSVCNNLLNKKICESQYSLRRNHENSESKGLLKQCYPCINEEILKLLIKQPIYSRDHGVYSTNLILKFCRHLYSSHENNCFFRKRSIFLFLYICPSYENKRFI